MKKSPSKPVTLDIDLQFIDNMLIISPPKEETLPGEEATNKTQDYLDFTDLDVDFLEEDLLEEDADFEFTELDIDYLNVNFFRRSFRHFRLVGRGARNRTIRFSGRGRYSKAHKLAKILKLTLQRLLMAAQSD